MSNSYNLTSKGESVRIGNWFEELKLKEDTGIRFYPSPTDRKTSLLTQERCITHTDQQHPRDYSSTTRDTIVRPDVHHNSEQNSSKLGPRQKRFEEKLRAQIEDEFKQKEQHDFTETRKINYQSTTQAGYLHPAFETGVNDKGNSSYIPTKNTNYSTDSAVTYYSHVIANQGMKANFPTTFVGASNPFKKNCAFSADPESEVFTRKAETNERPRPLPSLGEHRSLIGFRGRLLSSSRIAVDAAKGTTTVHLDGQAVRSIIETIWAGSGGSAFIELGQLERTLSDAYDSFSISHSEREAMLAAYDLRSDGQISLVELTHLVRGTPSPRRLELIDLYFSALCSPDTESIEFSKILSRMNANSESYLQSLMEVLNISEDNQGSISADDFFDYYIDVSNEVGDKNRVFEDILLRTWGQVEK